MLGPRARLLAQTPTLEKFILSPKATHYTHVCTSLGDTGGFRVFFCLFFLFWGRGLFVGLFFGVWFLNFWFWFWFWGFFVLFF